MAKNAGLVTETEEQKAKAPPNLFSLIPKIDLKFPFFNQAPKAEVKVKEEKPKTLIADDESESNKPGIVRVSFPKVAPKAPDPLEFEAEESVGRTSNPIVLWQVYALGGFLVLRWVWARWNERKERGTKKELSDDDQPPADDEDTYIE